jgi:hypothetical protein
MADITVRQVGARNTLDYKLYFGMYAIITWGLCTNTAGE